MLPGYALPRLRVQALQFREPKRARSVGRHAQVAAWRKRNRTNLWTIRHRRALKLLREEAAVEYLQPTHDSLVVVNFLVSARAKRTLGKTKDLECDDIQELKPGQALIVNKRGECSLQQILEPKQNAACSFERPNVSRSL